MADLEQLPAEASIAFVREDDYPLDVEVQDDSGNAIDFSQWSNEKLQVRDRQGSLQKEYTTSGNTLTTTSGGRVQATFAGSDNVDWPDEVDYEAEGDDGNGNHRTFLTGSIQLHDQISE